MRLPPNRSARTKVWCLLIIALGLGLLGLIFFRVFNVEAAPAALTTASHNAVAITQALRHYAQDHDGKFPEGTTNSNQAFRQLFPDYLSSERPFFVAGSAWHDAAPCHQPDDNIGRAPDFMQCLEKGENHWAYVSGLINNNSPTTPLIADGFADGHPGTYTDIRTQKGGRWNGSKAIIATVDGMVHILKVNRKAGYTVRMTKKDPIRMVDFFSHEGSLPENAKVLNPE